MTDVNLFGPQILTDALQEALAARKGAVLNFALPWTQFGSGRNPAYSASKRAVLQLIRTLEVGWATISIRVNAVAPG